MSTENKQQYKVILRGPCDGFKSHVEWGHTWLQRVLYGLHVIDVVTEYTYLGCLVNHDLSLPIMVRDRAEKGRKALMTLLPFLSNSTIPLALRVVVFKGTVLQTLLWSRTVGWLC